MKKFQGEDARVFIARILAEDIGDGDITSQATIPADKTLKAAMHAREDFILAGIELAAAIFLHVDPEADVQIQAMDGKKIKKGQTILTIEGNARAILGAERTALNVLQHLSGIATKTAQFVEKLKGTKAVLLDTRKTVPGLRIYEKYATKAGGAKNHRMGLYDAILIKDNHIAAAGGIEQAIKRAKAHTGAPIEVECDTLAQTEKAIAEGVDLILLDNMAPEDLKKAVSMKKGDVKLEASGGVTLENIREIAETGVDFISTSKITQSAGAVDIGLDYAD